MGLIICEKHGRTGIVNVCSHIKSSYEQRDNHNIECSLNKDQVGVSFYLCDKCVNKYKLTNDRVWDFDELQKFGNDLQKHGEELEIICGECFLEFLRE